MKKIKNGLFKSISLISTIIFIIFSIMLFKLNMIPFKLLIIILLFLGFIYICLLLFTFIRRIKGKIKLFSCFIFILFGIIFSFGIKYIGDTINFFDVINDDLSQKEVYYLCTSNNSEYSNINDFNNKIIGIYNSLNSEKAIKELKNKIIIEYQGYDSIIDLFNDLDDDLINGVLISESTKILIETELSDLNIGIKEIDKIYISIEEKDIVKVVDVTRKTFNIYVAGGDAYGSIKNVTNTDVNMVVTVDPINRKILLTSIPRDYYVNLPSFGESAYDKLTHAGYYGIEESVKTVEKLLDIDINYYVKVNFSTIEGVVDAIGGVDVYSDFTFKEDAFKLYTFYKGKNHLDGHMALAFARERKSFNDGDVQRVKNQQKVLQAVINKFTTSTTLVTRFSKILNGVSRNFATNMETETMNKFIKMQLNNIQNLREWKIESQNLVGYDHMGKTYTFKDMNLYVMKPNENSIMNAQSKIKEYVNEKIEEEGATS